MTCMALKLNSKNKICHDFFVSEALFKKKETEITLAADVESANHILLLASLPTHKFVSYSAKTLAKYPPERLGMKDKISILSAFIA